MKSNGKFRKLTITEIDKLTLNGCNCEDWTRVTVAEGFDPSRCVNVFFSGDVSIGKLTGMHTDNSGVSIRCGITNAHIHNCEIGSDVLITNIGDYIAN